MQQISLITLGVADLKVSRRFYEGGFGWSSVFEMEDIAFYQMNGLVFGLWRAEALAEDMQRTASEPGAAAYAHNVGSSEEVDALIERLCANGGRLVRAGDFPAYGGYRGYVADPDGHAWEIAWNPAWSISSDGQVRFAV